MNQKQIFVSYTKNDIDLATTIKNCIITMEKKLYPNASASASASAFNFFISEHNNHGDWHTTLKQKLQKSDIFICIATDAISESDWVIFEVGAFWLSGKEPFIFALGDAKANLPSPISNIHFKTKFSELAHYLFQAAYPATVQIEDTVFNTILESFELTFDETLSKYLDNNNVRNKYINEAARWEKVHDDTLSDFYVVFPEKIPYDSKLVIEAMRHNIKCSNTRYKYLLPKNTEDSIMHDLDELMTNLIYDENDEDTEKYKKQVRYLQLEADMIVEKFLYRTQIWCKHSQSSIPNEAKRVMLNESSSIGSMRDMSLNEVNSLWSILRDIERDVNLDWKYVSGLNNKRKNEK